VPPLNPPSSLDIAFWIDPAMLAGEAAFVRHLVMGLKSEGQEITFIAPHGTSLAELPVLGSRVLTYRWNPWERLPMLQKLRIGPLARELAARPPDVLIAWGGVGGGGGGAALATLSHLVPGLPLVLWCWDASELFTPLARLPALRHIVASSDAIASRLPDKFPAPVTVIHPGVYSDDVLNCFDVPGQMPCLVSLDPLSDRAAYEALLKACRMLADQGREFLLFAYDTGPAEYPIWRAAQGLQLLERMSFVPFQQDAEPLLLHGDLYIHIVPGGRVQYRSLEAMGRGLAVVTGPNHSADYLVDGQTCRVVSNQTPEAWCTALRELLDDPGRAIGLARRGQQWVRDRHSMARTLEQLVTICRQAVGMAIPLTPR
jgi:glycosyltransferase involved in cell wall biosynthesis